MKKNVWVFIAAISILLFFISYTITIPILTLRILRALLLLTSLCFLLITIFKLNINKLKIVYVFFLVLSTFSFLELVFIFSPISQGIDFSLASQVWFDTYWEENEAGFRDIELRENSDFDVFFIGDSFTAGHGLNSVADRFSNIFQNEAEKYGKEPQVFNLGYCGVDTKMEFEYELKRFIEKTQVHPEIVFLQYFGNDIEQVALNQGMKLPIGNPIEQMGWIKRNLISNSYFLNFIYWKTNPLNFNSYTNFLSEAYNDYNITKAHYNDIDSIIYYTQENDITLHVLVFPFMHNLNLSETMYASKIYSHLSKRKVPFTNVSSLIKKISFEDRIVNSNDFHASVEVNHFIGKYLYEIIYANQLYTE